MNLDIIAATIERMPDGPKKRKLQEKHQLVLQKIKEQKNAASQNQQGKGATGLNDTFKFEATGHIKIETIDKHGNIVDTLVDKENLVVKGADEIALRALSGDPTRILYKKRKILTNGVATGSLDKSLLKGRPFMDGSRIMHPANLVWLGVNEEDFQVEYSFIPSYVYVKEVASPDPSVVLFEISETPSTGAAPLQSEIYSTQTNLFIGLGDGKDRLVPFGEKIMSYSSPADFDLTKGQATTTKKTAFLKMSAKMSRFRVVLERSPLGGEVGIYVDGALKEKVVTYKSDGIDVLQKEITGLNLDKETELKLVLEGGTESGTPTMTIKEIHADALTVQMNQLFHEFRSLETDFSTPTAYNTKPDAPYTIQLPYNPVLKDSVTVSYQGKTFTEVATAANLTPETFYVDYNTGLVRFHRALTGVYIGFKLEEAIRCEEKVESANNKLTSTTHTAQTEQTKTETQKTIGQGDNTLDTFSLGTKTAKSDTVQVFLNGVAVTAFTVIENAVTGIKEVKMDTAPAMGDIVKATFDYTQMVAVNTPLLAYAPTEAIAEILSLVDQNGTPLVKVDTDPLNAGEYQVTATGLTLSTKAIDGTNLAKFTIKFKSPDFKGKATNYKRAVIEKPKEENLYPWFELDKGKIQFVTEFAEEAMTQNMTIREMILANGPREEDQIEGYDGYDVKAFSIVRVPETVKQVNTGIRITWTITLLNQTDSPFLGGNN